jgi:cyclase
MLTKRIIPCLDVKDGRVVKGVKFVDLRDKGDPAEHARRYDEEGADEITLLDITATTDGRRAMLDVIARTADETFTPLTVGGGVRAEADVEALLGSRADSALRGSLGIAGDRRGHGRPSDGRPSPRRGRFANELGSRDPRW